MYIFYIVIISVSLVGIFFILSAKISEITTGNAGILSKLSSSSDPMLRHWVEKIKYFVSHFNVSNAKKVFTTGAHGVFHVFGTAGLFVSKHHKRLTNRVNGQRTIKSGGVVSFFLKHVAESKGEEGKIE